MTKMQLTNVRGDDYTLTTEHAASSYGKPVLVSSDGTAYGPGDAIGDMRAETLVGNWAVWARDMLTADEQQFVANFAI